MVLDGKVGWLVNTTTAELGAELGGWGSQVKLLVVFYGGGGKHFFGNVAGDTD